MKDFNEQDLLNYDSGVRFRFQALWLTIVDWNYDWGWNELRIWCTKSSSYYKTFMDGTLDELIDVTHTCELNVEGYSNGYVFDIKIKELGLSKIYYERL